MSITLDTRKNFKCWSNDLTEYFLDRLRTHDLKIFKAATWFTGICWRDKECNFKAVESFQRNMKSTTATDDRYLISKKNTQCYSKCKEGFFRRVSNQTVQNMLYQGRLYALMPMVCSTSSHNVIRRKWAAAHWNVPWLESIDVHWFSLECNSRRVMICRKFLCYTKQLTFFNENFSHFLVTELNVCRDMVGKKYSQ